MADGSPEALSMRAERIAAVIWCTGFGPDTGWLRVPVLGPDGVPAHTRGITAFPGLYVAGLPVAVDPRLRAPLRRRRRRGPGRAAHRGGRGQRTGAVASAAPGVARRARSSAFSPGSRIGRRGHGRRADGRAAQPAAAPIHQKGARK